MMKGSPIKRIVLAVIVASSGMTAALAGAQEAGSRQTREYVQAAASSDQFEILSATTALAQSTNADVRAFAEHMLRDHRQLAAAISDAARSSGLKPPSMAMSADQAQSLGALQSVNGREFDALYLKQQKLAHSSALAVQQMYAKYGDDPGLRQSASSAVPLIASHADMANRIGAKLDQQ